MTGAYAAKRVLHRTRSLEAAALGIGCRVAVKNVIRAWARFPDMDRTQALEMPLERWLKLWFLEHTVNQRLILLAAAASPLLGGAAALWTRLRRRWAYSAAAAAQLYAVTLLSGLYWLYNAPDLRFGYGILLLLITLPLAWGLWLAGAAWRAPADWLARAAVLAIGVYLLSFLARSFQADSLAQRWLLPCLRGHGLPPDRIPALAEYLSAGNVPWYAYYEDYSVGLDALLETRVACGPGYQPYDS